MPKKKKKSRASGELSGAPTTPTGSSSTSISATKNKLEHQCLRLVKSTNASGQSSSIGKSLRYSPQLLLNEQDADDLDVVTGDTVILMCTSCNDQTRTSSETDNIVLGTAIATVKVARPIQPPSSPALGSSKLKTGYCQVSPPSLANHLLEGLEQQKKQQSTLLEHPSTPSKSSVSSTPSSSKSKFSFNAGGGGDLLISPSSTKAASTPSSQHKTTISHSSSTSDHQIWVVPFDSSTGSRISKLFCRDATSIRVLDPSKRLRMDAAFRTLGQKLFLANTEGSHIGNNMKITLSFQGQPLECTILDVEGRSNQDPVSDIASDLRQLSLHEGEGEDERLDGISTQAFPFQAIESMEEPQLNRLQLFRISHQTTVIFGEDSDVKPATQDMDDEKPALLVGLESTLAEVRSLLHVPLFRPSLFQGSLKPPRGVLVHGPSGAGKSLLARHIAQELQSKSVHVEQINCASLHAMASIVGQAEHRLSKLFQSAETYREGKSGSLIVLDDVHLICPRRGRATTSGVDRLASTLLALLDGISSENFVNGRSSPTSLDESVPKTPVVILAVTTNPSLLDPALRRPGRLDAEVEVPLPDEPSTRAKILQSQLVAFGGVESSSISSDQWLSLARLAKGFTGADCTLAVKSALQLALLGDGQPCDGPSGSHGIPVTVGDLERAIRSTKPSAIKSVTVEIPHVPWSSIGGMDEVKRQLREAIEFPLMHAQLFQDLGIPPPRGVLLYGPPGCSKTLMARALATEGQMNFLAVKGPELLSKWLGESERALASLFKRARLASPSVIFFDEIDAIASKRGSSSSSGGGERLLSQLLTELDGVQNYSSTTSSSTGNLNVRQQRVVVVGATNRPDLLDSALMRPGRMDRLIYVGIPDEKSRANIFQLGLKGKACSDDIDVSFFLPGEFVNFVTLTGDLYLFLLTNFVDNCSHV